MSLKRNKLIYIYPLNVLVIYLIYALASQFLFLMTTGGWASVIEMLYSTWIFPILWLILAIGFLCFNSGGFIRKRFFLRLLMAIAIFQVTALLFNYTTCGDGWGKEAYNYIQIIGFKLTEVNSSVFQICNLDPPIQPLLPYAIVLVIRFIYYFLNLILICLLLGARKSRRKPL